MSEGLFWNVKVNTWADFATPCSLLSSHVSALQPPPVPPPHPVLPPICHQAPSLFLLSLSFFHPVPPHPLSTLSLFPLFPGALFICFNPSGCLPWPSVLLSFNVGPMGTGVHSKTGRAWEQETGSRAGGEQPAVTSAPRLPHLDRSIPRALCLSHCSPPALASSVFVLLWSSGPERQQTRVFLDSDTGERAQGLK